MTFLYRSVSSVLFPVLAMYWFIAWSISFALFTAAALTPAIAVPAASIPAPIALAVPDAIDDSLDPCDLADSSRF